MNNSITVVGRVGQVPSSISFADTGKQLVKFSVAVKEFSPNTDEEKTLWFDVNAWNGLGERALRDGGGPLGLAVHRGNHTYV